MHGPYLSREEVEEAFAGLFDPDPEEVKSWIYWLMDGGLEGENDARRVEGAFWEHTDKEIRKLLIDVLGGMMYYDYLDACIRIYEDCKDSELAVHAGSAIVENAHEYPESWDHLPGLLRDAVVYGGF